MNKHKHYQTIRAYADGWKLEYLAKTTNEWKAIVDPTFLQNYEYRIVPDEDGWIPWYGGECPVQAGVRVQIKFANGTGESGAGSRLWWDHRGSEGDIYEYRIIEETPAPKKVKMWQWILAHKTTKAPYLTDHFFLTGEAAVSASGGFIIQRADWTEIEVEES